MQGLTTFFDRRAKVGPAQHLQVEFEGARTYSASGACAFGIKEREMGSQGEFEQSRDNHDTNEMSLSAKAWDVLTITLTSLLAEPGLHAQIEVHVDHASGKKVVAKRFSRPGKLSPELALWTPSPSRCLRSAAPGAICWMDRVPFASQMHSVERTGGGVMHCSKPSSSAKHHVGNV